MKTTFLLCFFILLLSQQMWSNNVQVSNVRLTGQNTTSDFTLVEFDISWENSWRYNGGPNNWDAAWIFVKYKIGNGDIWQHAWLNDSGHIPTSNATITSGLLSPALPFNLTTNPAMGVFLYRSTPSSGNFVCQGIKLRWNYGANGLSDNEQIDVKVFAIEMVYVPTGSFYVGSGGTEVGAFYKYPNTTTPYQITSEAAITVGTATNNLYYPNPGSSGDQMGPIPSAYPKGYNAFYAMKYELSQQAYVDFLNTLTRVQQDTRVESDISGTTIVSNFVMIEEALPLDRNSICCRTTLPPSPSPIEFFCNLNNNSTFGETSDGLGVSMNYLAYNDLAAYLDWASLRMMTEFEFEKLGRGFQIPYPNEYAWGNSTINKHNNLINPGQLNEIPAESYSNFAIESDVSPIRNGAFARNNSNRTLSGAGYYGCMELSGNLWESCVSVGNPEGRTYTGIHGNGLLTTNGEMDVSNWPVLGSAIGVSHRGGGYNHEIENARLSDRSIGTANSSVRYKTNGGRGTRSSM